MNNNELFSNNTTNAKPFLKWVGGKTQLLSALHARLPQNILKNGIINNYIEPFIGGGAFFFHLCRLYEIKKAVLLDINHDLVLCYKTIKLNHQDLIFKLSLLENLFLSLETCKRQEFFYDIRNKFNLQLSKIDFNSYNPEWIERATYLIFLNKTCFNGLYRINKKGGFNVPVGNYKNPAICQTSNIIEVSKALQNVEIIQGDFSKSRKFINSKSLVYLDPPYKPLNSTSSFTNYTSQGFNDEDQKRLAIFFKEIDEIGANVILSNSDPKNVNPDDDFFDELYSEFIIDRVFAKRMINCKGNKRGAINEIIISNNNIINPQRNNERTDG